jgi:hypothetical protein
MASTPVAHYGAGYAYDRGPGRRTESGSIMEPLLGAALLACS